jgi:hypothetical protein
MVIASTMPQNDFSDAGDRSVLRLATSPFEDAGKGYSWFSALDR